MTYADELRAMAADELLAEAKRLVRAFRGAGGPAREEVGRLCTELYAVCSERGMALVWHEAMDAVKAEERSRERAQR